MQDHVSLFVKHPGVDFTRNRCITFSSLFLLLLTMETHTLNREMRRFFSWKNSHPPSKSAFIQQRDKLNEEAFPFLFTSMNQAFPFKATFRGYHLFACDGSDINIPPLKGDLQTYVSSNTDGVGYHQMHLNAIYDILEERYVDILVQPRADINERDAFLTFLRRNPVPGKCLYIADRGYFSFNVLAHLLQSGQFFLLRINTDGPVNSFLTRFSLSEEKEFLTTLDFAVTRSRKKFFAEHPDYYIYLSKSRRFDFIPKDDKDSFFPLSARLAKIDLPSGAEYLLTNLPEKTFGLRELQELYHLRWGIETSFRFLKYNVSLNSFHSIRRDFIMQEVFARVILYNFTMLIVHSVTLPSMDRKHHYKVSVSDAVVTCRDFLIHRVKNAEIKNQLLYYLTDVRPGRSSPRKKRSKRYIPFNNRA